MATQANFIQRMQQPAIEMHELCQDNAWGLVGLTRLRLSIGDGKNGVTVMFALNGHSGLLFLKDDTLRELFDFAYKQKTVNPAIWDRVIDLAPEGDHATILAIVG